jgi:hypothetical protein
MSRNLSTCAYYQTQGKPDGQRASCSIGGCYTEPRCITEEPEGGWPDPAEVDYHEAHQAYIDAVAAALTAAGFTVIDWYADPNDPRDGAIALEPVGAFSADELWLGWQEERGWTVLTIDEGKGWNKRDGVAEDARYVHDVLVPLLAAPSTVVCEFADMAKVKAFVAGDRWRDLNFPEHSFEDDDPQFEAALAAYRKDES